MADKFIIDGIAMWEPDDFELDDDAQARQKILPTLSLKRFRTVQRKLTGDQRNTPLPAYRARWEALPCDMRDNLWLIY